jgi:hypothetical protein
MAKDDRKLRGLRAVREIDEPPFDTRKKRTGAQAKGIAYERKVGRDLGHLVAGLPCEVRSAVWLEYDAARGTGYAQPDHILVFDDRVICVECKLTHRVDIRTKLLKFYRRLLRRLYPGKEVHCAQVYRNNLPQSPMAPGLEALLGSWPPSQVLEVNHR